MLLVVSGNKLDLVGTLEVNIKKILELTLKKRNQNFYVKLLLQLKFDNINYCGLWFLSYYYS